MVVVGGGYTGLWTAWHLKQLRPEARVVVIEADGCGEGPSGRNGGFVNALWFSLPTLRERFGDAAAVAVARAAQHSVDRDRRLLRGAGRRRLVPPGRLPAGLDRAGLGRRRGAGRAGLRASSASRTPAARSTPAEVRRRCASPIFRGGAFYPGAATVQPARLARGLAKRVRERGVEVFERTPVPSVAPRGGDESSPRPTAGGCGPAPRCSRPAVALAGHPGMRRRLTVTSSHIVITEPVPELLEEIGWTGGECITDSRAMVHYFRTTPDGRIAFGWGGGRVVFGARTARPRRARPGRSSPRSSATCSASSPGSRASGSSTPGAGRSTSRRPTCR